MGKMERRALVVVLVALCIGMGCSSAGATGLQTEFSITFVEGVLELISAPAFTLENQTLPSQINEKYYITGTSCRVEVSDSRSMRAPWELRAKLISAVEEDSSYTFSVDGDPNTAFEGTIFLGSGSVSSSAYGDSDVGSFLSTSSNLTLSHISSTVLSTTNMDVVRMPIARGTYYASWTPSEVYLNIGYGWDAIVAEDTYKTTIDWSFQPVKEPRSGKS